MGLSQILSIGAFITVATFSGLYLQQRSLQLGAAQELSSKSDLARWMRSEFSCAATAELPPHPNDQINFPKNCADADLQSGARHYLRTAARIQGGALINERGRILDRSGQPIMPEYRARISCKMNGSLRSYTIETLLIDTDQDPFNGCDQGCGEGDEPPFDPEGWTPGRTRFGQIATWNPVSGADFVCKQSASCAADDSWTETMTFPAGVNCSNQNCAHTIAGQLKSRIDTCLGHSLNLVGGHDTIQRTSFAQWWSGSTSRWRTSSHSEGTLETHSLQLICRIFGYQSYESSTARDNGDNRGKDRLNWTGAGDNTSWRFQNSTTFEDLLQLPASTLDPRTGPLVTNVNRRTIGNGKNAYYQTWLQTLTCSGKIQ